MALKEREKRTLLVGGVSTLLIVLGWLLIFREESPWNRWLDFKTTIADRENVLDRMGRLQRQYFRLRSETERVQRRMATGEGETELSRGMVEKLVREKAPSASVKQMVPDRQVVHGVYQEIKVKVELTDLPLPELIALLYALEYEGGPQVIQELTVDLNRKNNDLLDAVITVAAASPLKQGEKEAGK